MALSMVEIHNAQAAEKTYRLLDEHRGFYLEISPTGGYPPNNIRLLLKKYWGIFFSANWGIALPLTLVLDQNFPDVYSS